MIASIDNFNTFYGNYEAGDGVTDLKTSILSAAEDKVKEYLGFDPVQKTCVERYTGTSSDYFYTDRKNITAIEYIKVDGAEIDDYSFEDDKVYSNDGTPIFCKGINNIEIKYTSGWTESNVPSAIKIAILRIASLMFEETNGNIGVTSKSYSDNSRTFVKLTDYRDYLKQISNYKVLRF